MSFVTSEIDLRGNLRWWRPEAALGVRFIRIFLTDSGFKVDPAKSGWSARQETGHFLLSTFVSLLPIWPNAFRRRSLGMRNNALLSDALPTFHFRLPFHFRGTQLALLVTFVKTRILPSAVPCPA